MATRTPMFDSQGGAIVISERFRPVEERSAMTFCHNYRTDPFTLDAAGIASTYDTSGGVGITGRGVADGDARLKGLPFWMLPAGCVVVLALLQVGYHYGELWLHDRLSGLKGHKPVVASAPAEKLVVKVVPAVSGLRSAGSAVDLGNTPMSGQGALDQSGSYPILVGGFAVGGSPDDTNTVFCVGYTVLDKDVMVFLSDGSTAYSDSGEVTQVSPRWVTAFGRRYRVIVGRSVSLPVVERLSDRSASVPVESSFPAGGEVDSVPVSRVEILPSVNSEASALQAPPRLNGLASLSGSLNQARSAP